MSEADFETHVYNPDEGGPDTRYVVIKGARLVFATDDYRLPAIEASTPLSFSHVAPDSPFIWAGIGDSISYGEVEGYWPRNAQLEVYACAADMDRRFRVIERPREIVEKRRDWEDRNYRRPKKRKRK